MSTQIIAGINKSNAGKYPPNFQRYVDAVKEEDLSAAFKNQMPAAEIFFQSIHEELSKRKYAEDKWTIKEVLQHVIDAERIFAYRALAFARKDTNTLPPFDENEYTVNGNANDRLWNDLTAEFTAVRKSTEYLYSSFSSEALHAIGRTSDYSMGVSTLGFVIVGHVNHHIRVIQERYIGI